MNNHISYKKAIEFIKKAGIILSSDGNMNIFAANNKGVILSYKDWVSSSEQANIEIFPSVKNKKIKVRKNRMTLVNFFDEEIDIKLYGALELK